MQPGDTFHADFGCGGHLHVVLSYPYGEKCDLNVVTLISTYTEDYQNSTCILRPSDGHPFIKRISYVAYNIAHEVRERDLKAMGASMKPAFSEDVLDRILKGADAFNSGLPIRYLKILENQKLIPR
jgi:hypothetical protein